MRADSRESPPWPTVAGGPLHRVCAADTGARRGEGGRGDRGTDSLARRFTAQRDVALQQMPGLVADAVRRVVRWRDGRGEDHRLSRRPAADTRARPVSLPAAGAGTLVEAPIAVLGSRARPRRRHREVGWVERPGAVTDGEFVPRRWRGHRLRRGTRIGPSDAATFGITIHPPSGTMRLRRDAGAFHVAIGRTVLTDDGVSVVPREGVREHSARVGCAGIARGMAFGSGSRAERRVSHETRPPEQCLRGVAHPRSQCGRESSE